MKDDWQHPIPHPIKTNIFTQHNDSQTPGTQQNESEDDLYEIYRDPLTDTSPQILTKVTKKYRKICLNLNTNPHHKTHQNLFRKTILNLSKHKTHLKYQPNLHQHKNYPSLMMKFKIILRLIKKQIYQCFFYQPT